MRNILFCFGLFFLLFACNSDNKKDMSANGNEEQELMALESEMIDFFQSTLEKNYGDRYAVELLIKGLRKYDYNYVLDIDKQRLKEINCKLYGDGWFASYFFDVRMMNDSDRVVIPKGMTYQQYRQSDKFKQDLKEKDIDTTRRVIYGRDAEWNPVHQRVESIAFYMLLHPQNGSSYYRNEMLTSSHQVLKETVEEINEVGEGVSPYAILQYIESNRANVLSDFKSDRDVQMFLTLYFWKYLCHSANIDFRTGEDRTEVVMKEAGY